MQILLFVYINLEFKIFFLGLIRYHNLMRSKRYDKLINVSWVLMYFFDITFAGKIIIARSQKVSDTRCAICANNAASVRLAGCRCTSARKTDMSRATNWSVLREYKKADIHPLTYVCRARNGRDNRSTWNLRLKLTNAVARSREMFCCSCKIICHFSRCSSLRFFSRLFLFDEKISTDTKIIRVLTYYLDN